MSHAPSSATRSIARRDFLRGALLASTFPFIATTARGQTAGSSGAAPAGRKVNLACCGIGNRGANVVDELMKTGLANIVALCDTDMGAPHTLAILKKYPNVPRFQDFRKMLDKMGGQIDAVSVGVPDHTHFPICMHAMALGKHVYVEKPMAHTFREIALMMAAEKKFKVAAQMGNQGHSDGNYFQFKAFVEAGLIKNVRKVVGHMNGVRRWHKWNGQVPGLPAGQPVPEGLDWDTWLGHKPFVDYHRDYVQGDWRCWYQFGNGALGDWGAHILDTAHEFLQLGLPNAVSAVKMEGHNPYVFPMASTLQFKFPERGAGRPACDVFWYDGQKNFPDLPANYGQAVVADDVPPPGAGSTATAAMPPGKEIYTDDLIFKGGSHGTTLAIIPEAKAKDMAGKLPKVPKSPSNHFKNFLLACQGEETCRSSFAVAGPLCQMMALGIIAQRLNASFQFDRSTLRITDHPAADALLDGPPPRTGWEQYYKV
jgi:predicted dehydrogenase